MAIAEGQWTIVHGDSSRSPVFAVCTRDGAAVDLNDWVVRAQGRNGVDSIDITYGWSAGHGIDLSTGTVHLSNSRRVETSTVGLSLLPGDFAQLPREWSGIVEIEIATDSTSSPAQRYTVARLTTRIVPDITHDVGALIVNPGLPAPSAPAGGVLAGSYPNPVFAVPMATTADLNTAIGNASTEDRKRTNHTGTQSADTLTDGSTNRAYTATERTKLQGIAAGATVNAPDEALRDRATHTGYMFSTGVSDFAEAVQDTMAGSFVEGLNVSIAYSDTNGTFTISSSGGGGGGSGAGGVSGVRSVNGNTNAFTNELLLVDASGGQVTISPPPGAPVGTQVTLIKSDPSSNIVVWNAPTNSDTSAGLQTRWGGATFTFNGSVWVVTATNRTLSGSSQAAIEVASSEDRKRQNHTGYQTATTISDLTETVQDIVGAMVLPGSNISVNYDDPAGTLTIHSTSVGGSGGGLSAEDCRDVIGAALRSSGPITVIVNDAADTITISTTATQNSTDAYLLSRTNHTGTAPSTSVGLGNVANLAPADLPVSTATNTALSNYVPTSQRGPIGGVQTLSYVTPRSINASLGVAFRVVASGNITFPIPTGGVDGQRILIEVQAFNVPVTVTFDPGYEVSGGAPNRSVTLAPDTWAEFGIKSRSGTWRLVYMDPQ